MCLSAICMGGWNCLIQIRTIRDVPRQWNGGFGCLNFFIILVATQRRSKLQSSILHDAFCVLNLLFNVYDGMTNHFPLRHSRVRQLSTCRTSLTAFPQLRAMVTSRAAVAREGILLPTFIYRRTFPARRMYSVNGTSD